MNKHDEVTESTVTILGLKEQDGVVLRFETGESTVDLFLEKPYAKDFLKGFQKELKKLEK